MQFSANARFIRYSPFKLRPIADVVRGKNVQDVLNWLATYATQRAAPVQKAVHSAAANAKNLKNFEAKDLTVKEIRVDQGPSFRYFKPGAQGRSNIQTKRFSHIRVILEPVAK